MKRVVSRRTPKPPVNPVIWSLKPNGTPSILNTNGSR